MALLGYSKEQLKKNLVVGIGLSVVLYLVFRYGLKNVIAPKGNTTTPTSNFVGADGNSEDGYVALRYDASHVNTDGSKGATWVGYKGSDVVGYWQKGVIAIGTKIHSLT
jgi:hypothetical protein